MKKAILAAAAVLGLGGCTTGYGGLGTGISIGYGNGYGSYSPYGYGSSYGGYSDGCLVRDRYGRVYDRCGGGGGYGGYGGYGSYGRYGDYGSYGGYGSAQQRVIVYPNTTYRNGYYYDRAGRRYGSRHGGGRTIIVHQGNGHTKIVRKRPKN
jgi:hypothetical protein